MEQLALSSLSPLRNRQRYCVSKAAVQPTAACTPFWCLTLCHIVGPRSCLLCCQFGWIGETASRVPMPSTLDWSPLCTCLKLAAAFLLGWRGGERDRSLRGVVLGAVIPHQTGCECRRHRVDVGHWDRCRHGLRLQRDRSL
mmetsp:Transcript_987/g.1873  ORF Transcript_987/g.1873 Transcript_987/m.1873 type:complete len:141 (+) Transcript_987:71-493(+)